MNTNSEKHSRRNFIKNAALATTMVGGGFSSSFHAGRSIGQPKKSEARIAAMEEFTKALWVHIGASFANGVKDVPYVLDKWANAGFKLLILRIRMSDGKTLYQRTKHKVAEIAKNWDPVAAINEEAQKRNMRVHPWCQVFRGARSEFAISRPDLLGINQLGENVDDFLCAAQDEVQEWSYSYFEELMENYDTAGIHLDFVRFAEHTCWCNYCKKVFKRETGIELAKIKSGSAEWARWITQRVHHINRFVIMIQQEAKRRNKETSAAVYASYPRCVETVGQDWLTWAHERWVDYILPMNYYGEKKRFRQNAAIHINGVNNKTPVFEGVACNLPGSPFNIQLSPDELLERSQYVKEMGYQGICYFVSQHLTDEHLKKIKML